MALYTSISVSPSTREINGTNSFAVSIAYSITASRLINTKVTVAGQTYSIGTVTSTSFTWTPPLALLNSMQSLSSATVTITGTPANSNNTSLVGEISTYCSVTVPASYMPTAPTGVTLTRVDNGVPPAWGVYVQNKSKMNVSWAASSGTGGATISQYRIYTDTNSYYTATGTSISGLGPFSAGSRTVTVVAVDSRGRTATSSGVAYTVEPYSVPGVSTHKVDRTTAAGVVDNLGTYMKASLTFAFASVGGKNSATARFAHKPTSSSTYSAETNIAQSIAVIFGGSFSSLTAYHVRFTVTDALGSITTFVATVDSLKIALEFESNSNRLWVHCPLTMNADATFNNLITSGGNSHLMLNGQSYISLRTGGTERGYFHSSGFQVLGSLAATGAVSGNSLSVTGSISGNSLSITNGATCNNLEAYNTITCQNLTAYNLISSGSSSHLYLRGSTYVSLQTGSTERGYFHSGGFIVHGRIECANLTVTNPPWPTSVTLPSSPSFSGTVYGNSFYAYADSPGYAINSYSMVNIVSSLSRFNYGLRSIYDSAVHGASRVSFRIGDTERAYVTTSGVANNSLSELKVDIQDAGSALAIVRDATLYKYRYTVPPVESVIAAQAGEEALPIAQPLIEKSEATRAAPQVLGFVIGEGYEPPPECVLAEDGRGVNLYAMSSVCWRGLQELLARVTALERR